MPASPPSVLPPSTARLLACDMPRDMAQGARIAAMAAFGDALYLVVDAGGAGALWRYDIATQAWHRMPWNRLPCPPCAQDAGAAAMTVFRGAGDAAPCLYVAMSGADGVRLWRSADGHDYAPVLTLPASHGYLAPTSLAPVALAVWDGRLVMASGAPLPGPAAAAGTLPRGCILASPDPARAATWELLSEPGFGDPDNIGVTALAVHQGRLCAGTVNPLAGFQIWARSPDDPRWTCLIDRGATRHGMNPAVGLLASHHGYLWIGTAMDQPRIAGLDWPAAELLRIEPDGVWELIAGEARFTPEGLRLPLSLLGPGFEDPGVTRLGTMAELQDGRLILGGGPLPGLWISAGEEDWEPLLQDADGGGDGGGVTAMARAAGRVWIAMDGRLFTLGPGA